MTASGGTIARKTVPTSRMRSPLNAFFTGLDLDGLAEVSAAGSSAGFCVESMDTPEVVSFGEVLKNLRQPRCFRVISS
jgi:hypothetical protein